MKVFDVHTDILYDVYKAKEKGIKNRFKDMHVAQLTNSVITGGIWTIYSAEEFDLLAAYKTALSEIDMSLLPGFELMLGLEGLMNLKEPKDIKDFYNLGIRHAMLTWNEENKYAGGVAAEASVGLKEAGIELLDIMMELGMIIDVAHLNEKSFFDVLAYLKKKNYSDVIFSHGNVKVIHDHRRNLTLKQMEELRDMGGLFGLTLAKSFVRKEEAERNLEHFLNHLDEAVKVMGEDQVMFGFDFMDYLGDDGFSDAMIHEVPNATKAYLIIEGMRKRGYSEEVIEKICYSNFMNKYRKHLYRG